MQTQIRTALESSFWELNALEKHYHHAISTLAKSIGNEDDKTTPMHDMEDFLAHTYKSLFELEKKRLGSGAGGGGDGGGKKNGGGCTPPPPPRQDAAAGYPLRSSSRKDYLRRMIYSMVSLSTRN